VVSSDPVVSGDRAADAGLPDWTAWVEAALKRPKMARSATASNAAHRLRGLLGRGKGVLTVVSF
jgi:hypothetical protein